MRILTCLTYYHPYLSGLTLYAQRLAEALAARGHTLTVLAGQHQPQLLTNEVVRGVAVRRIPARLRIGKGLVMPGMIPQAWRHLRQADVLHLHLPQVDGAYLAMLARLCGIPTVVTYHCDLSLPKGWLNRVSNAISNMSGRLANRLAEVVVVNTRDYAEHSPLLRASLHKAVQVLPPAQVAWASPEDRIAFAQRARIQPRDRVIGMIGRVAAEKGVDVLAEALPIVQRAHPSARVLHAGAFQDVPGEAAYFKRVMHSTAALGDAWRFLGPLPDGELAAFYEACDVTVLPSTNSTESFGMVQVESMLCGTPVVASALPGVRVPVQMSGMGRLVSPNDPISLAEAISAILAAPRPPRANVLREINPHTVAERYEKIFNSL
jgi:glycosyltransferase involved in cell wall biosynthesis